MIQTIVGGNLSPVIVEKNWGYEMTVGVSSRIALKKVSLRPHEALSRQVHIFKEEIYLVMAGQGRLELGPQAEIVHALTAGDAVFLPPGVVHRLRAGENGIVVIEASTPEVNDIIRLADEYNRKVNPDLDSSQYREVFSKSPQEITVM